MSTTHRLACALLLTSALTVPSFAYAQSGTQVAPQAPAQTGSPTTAPAGQINPEDNPSDDQNFDIAVPGDDPTERQPVEEEPEISIPGGSQITVTGRVSRDPARNSAQVLTVLSTEQIARTGEGDIAGALSRVTGLSVVGAGFVYVRGLGDRYSLALLNGSPLPSPEPLRRVVPLDLFPTGVISSALVQKSYSVNFPGEFGGGVINLTTRSTPNQDFLSIGAGVSGDTYTTGNRGFSYYGGDLDFLGYDDGSRDLPQGLNDFFASGALVSEIDQATQKGIIRQLVNPNNAGVQSLGNIPANVAGNISGGKTFDIGGGELGVVFNGGYSNAWLTRQVRQRFSRDFNLSSFVSDFTNTNTDQRVVANGLLGLGYEFGDSIIRATGVYIHDTVKRAQIGVGQIGDSNNADFLNQRTAFFARQLIDGQLVAELQLSDRIELDLRGSYANSKRLAPEDITFTYVRNNVGPFGDFYVNRLDGVGRANYVYSRLNENLYSGGGDLSVQLFDPLTITVGGAYYDQRRVSTRRDLDVRAQDPILPGQPNITNVQQTNIRNALGITTPYVLLSPGVVDAFNFTLQDNDPGSPVYRASLVIRAGYAKANLTIGDLLIDAGVRYENATERTMPVQVFNNTNAVTQIPANEIDRDYFLPAATITYNFSPTLQGRISGSKTLARPQFRELIYQQYFDPDSNLQYRGNPFLVDSQLYNAEARLEYYPGRDERISLAGFYKKLENPIESFVQVDTNNGVTVSFANAPRADLYGAEFEVQKFIDLAGLGNEFFAERRLALIGNYTYTQSELGVEADDTTRLFISSIANPLASTYFRDGAPLVGQSDHLVNLQVGLEAQDHLSQQTILLSYASNRVSQRGFNSTPSQPDVVEVPGIRIDYVMREGVRFYDTDVELKFEARNIFGVRHREFQQFEDTVSEFNTYDLGTVLALSAAVQF